LSFNHQSSIINLKLRSIMRICVFEDAGVANLQPLTASRPVFDLRCGARSLLQRQQSLFPAAHAQGVWVRPELTELCRLVHSHLAVNEPIALQAHASARGRSLAGGCPPVSLVLINGRWLPPGSLADSCLAPGVGEVDGEVAYVAVPADSSEVVCPQDLDQSLAQWQQTLPRHDAGGLMLDYPWDLVEQNHAALEQDYRNGTLEGDRVLRPGLAIVGPPERCRVAPTAHLDPLVVVDTTKGPVLIDEGARVQAFSRLEGPCYIGEGTHVLGAQVRGSSLGPHCRIGGEVEASIVHGYSNKAHDGFLGHSYLGEWVNLGAGTQTSDLRNDYNEVSVILAGRKVNTGLQKVGSFMGDHTKTSINAALNTGGIIGCFAQVLASGSFPPRVLPSFCQFGHGQVQERTDLRQLFTTAAAVMKRRGQLWTDTHADFYFGLHEQTAEQRRDLLRESEQRRLRRAV
jgi:UDP-N-acetylglucosamine diphosphorylase/glucosamine-1-phosphate N-acetyltransferase